MEVSYFSAMLAGLLGGIHCIGMCGGIISALSFHQQTENQKISWPILLSYNAGRISSYVVAGIGFGSISLLVANWVEISWLQSLLKLLACLLMIVLGLYLGGWWSGITRLERVGVPIWKKIEPFSRRFIPVRNFRQAYVLGLLWGWLPCGLVYTALFMSVSSGSAWQGGIVMLCFGLGTLPTLLLMGAFASKLKSLLHKLWLRQLAGGLLILFSIYSLFLLYQSVVV